MSLAPIIAFVYNRPDHTSRMLQSLAANTLAGQSELIVFADGPKKNASAENLLNIKKVHDIIQSQTWCKKLTVHIQKENKGLAASIIHGVTTTLQQYNSVIVLEDDLLLSPHFLEFMNDGLQKYEHTEEVISIHGFSIPVDIPEPVYFLRGSDCWGWATWKRGWQLFNADGAWLLQALQQKKLVKAFDLDGNYDFSGMLKQQIEGKVNSWAIRWHASAFLLNKLTLHPSRSLVQNIGDDGSGTHPQNGEQSRTYLNPTRIILPDIPVRESIAARKFISKHHYAHLGLKGKLKKILKRGP